MKHKKRTGKELVMAFLLLAVGIVLLELTGEPNWGQLIIMTICGAGGMLLLIFIEWFFLVYRKNKKSARVENRTEEKIEVPEKIMPYSQNDICVICGEYCPEGRHVCERCEKNA